MRRFVKHFSSTPNVPCVRQTFQLDADRSVRTFDETLGTLPINCYDVDFFYEADTHDTHDTHNAIEPNVSVILMYPMLQMQALSRGRPNLMLNYNFRGSRPPSKGCHVALGELSWT